MHPQTAELYCTVEHLFHLRRHHACDDQSVFSVFCHVRHKQLGRQASILPSQEFRPLVLVDMFHRDREAGGFLVEFCAHTAAPAALNNSTQPAAVSLGLH